MEPNDYSSEFDVWMQKVDNCLVNTCGLGHQDLPDKQYMCMFEDQYTPNDAAAEVLEDEGYTDLI